jgi:hypothetical protein
MATVSRKAAALIASLLCLTASGCATQLSTVETCRELRALEQSTPSNPSETEKKRIVDGVNALANRSSDALKSDMQILAKFMRNDPNELYRDKSKQDVQKWLDDRKASYERITVICPRS